eukprot:4137084-Alexandrium_andersonii.AAC.1
MRHDSKTALHIDHKHAQRHSTTEAPTHHKHNTAHRHTHAQEQPAEFKSCYWGGRHRLAPLIDPSSPYCPEARRGAPRSAASDR